MNHVTVAGGNGQAAEDGLRDDHPVERVLVVPVELPGHGGVGGVDREVDGVHPGDDIGPGVE